MDTLGERLRTAREHIGITQTEAAKRAGINNKSLNHYESNRVEPNMETLSKLANVYGVTTDSLLGIREMTKPEIDPELSVLLKSATPEQIQRVMDFLEGKVDSPVEYTDEELAFIDGVEQGMSLEELAERFKPTVGGRPATQEEIEYAVKQIKAKRIIDIMD